MKKIWKKVRVLSIALLSIVLAVSLLGCPSEGGQPSGGGTTFQSQIDNATAGSSVTLNRNYSGNSITINKALTVDGNGIENLTITIASNVSNNVTLRNFRNANVTVASSSRRALDNRMARAANDAEEADKFAKIGDGDLPLHIEGCTIEKLDLGKDVALYLENGDEKSIIEELSLKEGVVDFSFIEFDENGKEVADKTATATAEKSKIEKLSIEDDGIEKINLIGGVISDVDFADGVTAAAIDSLKFDKEFADQFGNEAKTALLDAVPAAKKEDVGVAKRTDSTNIYSFTMSKDTLAKTNGAFSIIFLKDDQLESIQSGNTISSIASFNNPIYVAIPAGCFKVDYQGNETDGTVKTIYGTEWAYVDYAHAFARGLVWNYGLQDIVVLDHYRNYNKNAFAAKINADTVTVYVNMAEIKKSDVICCAYSEDDQAYGEAATKLTDLNLSGYKPYFTASLSAMQYFYRIANPSPARENYDSDQAWEEAGTQYSETLNGYFAGFQGGNNPLSPLAYSASSQQHGTIQFWPPYGASVKLQYELLDCTLSVMTEENEYPTVPTNYPSISTPHYGRTELHPLQEQDFDELTNP